ncbi:hypothetical protein AB835_02435 [Candidatus Endobugula sertula]|uniref:aldehyde dehydrogenase (NAD(+)) n=1 Tax=Candidatus Endobugula sertula TaxID=62101 RepID=A0A1D2QT27_9GAMM|nr:hypothetical protein AB835_02435 [Candidatus Endobugula sertula]
MEYAKAIKKFDGKVPEGLIDVIIGGREQGEQLVNDARVPLISATGSTAMGRIVGPKVAQRFGRSILELGGNNAIIVTPSADLEMAVRGIVFGAVGTCGQRCTTTRRLIVHESVYDQLISRLKEAYDRVAMGSPLEDDILVGPLIDKDAFDAMQQALRSARSEGGQVFGGDRVVFEGWDTAYYVKPALVEMSVQTDAVKHETFAPILYVFKYTDYAEAIAIHNDVPQGLSSAIFTTNLL